MQPIDPAAKPRVNEPPLNHIGLWVDNLAAAVTWLTSQGMRFTNGHSSSGVCSPSRYTLLTGRYHWRTRLQSGIVGAFEGPLLAPDRMTIGTLAKQQGYRTACIGKWHLGMDWPATKAQRALLTPAAGAVATPEQIAAWKEIFSQPIAGGPTTRGFDLLRHQCPELATILLHRK